MPRPRPRRPSAARAARPPRQGAARRGAPARGSARGTRLGRERRTHRRRRRGAPGSDPRPAAGGGAHVTGIAGLWRRDGRPGEPAELDGMLARVAHRGPDGTGAWREGPVALGHGMLHTTPESLREQQPLVGTRGDLVLVADARIDNRGELCSLLPAPSDATDAELILAAYERWGEHCPEHLLGDFAFAMWDGRTQRLFCARDHFGVKPLYYHHRPSRLFAFASEIKGLLALPDVPRRLNETRVADYLVPLLEDKVITFYEEIVRLPPAHRMVVSRDGVLIEQYWALDPEREIRMKSDAEYAEAFREIFTEAVRCRLRSAFPVGSMLSGGLDSSSIACVARELLAEDGGGKLHTFSAIFPDVPECDEREYIDAVVAGGGGRCGAALPPRRRAEPGRGAGASAGPTR